MPPDSLQRRFIGIDALLTDIGRGIGLGARELVLRSRSDIGGLAVKTAEVNLSFEMTSRAAQTRDGLEADLPLLGAKTISLVSAAQEEQRINRCSIRLEIVAIVADDDTDTEKPTKPPPITEKPTGKPTEKPTKKPPDRPPTTPTKDRPEVSKPDSKTTPPQKKPIEKKAAPKRTPSNKTTKAPPSPERASTATSRSSAASKASAARTMKKTPPPSTEPAKRTTAPAEYSKPAAESSQPATADQLNALIATIRRQMADYKLPARLVAAMNTDLAAIARLIKAGSLRQAQDALIEFARRTGPAVDRAIAAQE